MYSTDKSFKTLWLSDIHFKSHYILTQDDYEINLKNEENILNILEQDPKSKLIETQRQEIEKIRSLKESNKKSNKLVLELFSAVVDFYKKENNVGAKFDYIIITGDLAFAGKSDEYDFLFENLIKHFECPVITIPGNHDCNWGTIPKELYSYTVDELYDFFKNRNDYLSNSKTYLKACESFKDYTSFFKSKIRKSGDKILDFQVKTEGLYGLIRNFEKKHNFILINSAWFAFGNEYNNIISETIKGFSDSNNKVDDAMKAAIAASEQGKLVIGKEKLEEYLEFLDADDSFYNICLIHHPFHWLDWREQYNYYDNLAGTTEEPILSKILKKSDLVLSGHEHLPINIEYDVLQSGGIHLKAGMLMDDTIKVNSDAKNFENCRFSILEYNNKTLVDRRIIFKKDSTLQKLVCSEVSDFNKKIDVPKRITKKYYIKGDIDLEVLSRVQDSFKVSKFIIDFNKKHRNRNLIEFQTEDVIETTPKNEDAHIFCFGVDEIKDDVFIFIVHKKVNFFENINERIGVLDNLIKVLVGKVIHIGFFSLDLIVSMDLSEEYLKTTLSKEERYDICNRITKYSDSKFDLFRHHFFNREKVKKDISKFAEISVFNEIIPFWVWISNKE